MLRNKNFPNKVLDFQWSDYQKNSWGKVYLHNENGEMNQRWSLRGDEFFCHYGMDQNFKLVLDVHSSSTQNGAKVGCTTSTGGDNQKWFIQIRSWPIGGIGDQFGLPIGGLSRISKDEDRAGLGFDGFNSEGNTTKKKDT